MYTYAGPQILYHTNLSSTRKTEGGDRRDNNEEKQGNTEISVIMKIPAIKNRLNK